MPSKTSAPVRVLLGGLTAEKQDAINALVKSRVDELPESARVAAAITLWSSLKSKFGCTYKAIPPDCFVMTLQQFLHTLNDPNGYPVGTDAVLEVIVSSARRLQARMTLN